MSKVRLAVIGAGVIGRKHIRLIVDNPACELVAICDADPQYADLAKAQQVPFYQDCLALLATTNLDGAIIATPTANHAAVGICCAEHAIPMLIEKPLTATLAEGQQLLAVANQHDTPILVGHYRRFNPLVQQVRNIIHKGDLGKLLAVSVLWTLQKHDAYFDVAWRTQAGGGPILINTIHDIDNLRFICGDISSVFAVTTSYGRGHQVEDTASISLQFSSGSVGSVTVSDATPSPWSYESTMYENPDFAHHRENCYYFLGSKNSLAFPRMEQWYYPADKNQPHGWDYPLHRHEINIRHSDPLTRQLQHFCQVVQGEEPPLISAADGLMTLASTLAINESSHLNAPVSPAQLLAAAG